MAKEAKTFWNYIESIFPPFIDRPREFAADSFFYGWLTTNHPKIANLGSLVLAVLYVSMVAFASIGILVVSVPLWLITVVIRTMTTVTAFIRAKKKSG